MSLRLRKNWCDTILMGVPERQLALHFLRSSPPCQCVLCSQIDAVRQLNDACLPSLAVAAAAVYMQNRGQMSCKTHVLIYVRAQSHDTNIIFLKEQINATITCDGKHFIWGFIRSISDRTLSILILIPSKLSILKNNFDHKKPHYVKLGILLLIYEISC